MDFQPVMAELEKAGSEQTRKTYRRHGAKDPMFGVSYAVLAKLTKAIKQDDALARKLWATDNHDAQVLALMIADPALASLDQLKEWAESLKSGFMVGQFGKYAVHTPHVNTLIKLWKTSKNEWLASIAWLLLGMQAANPDTPEETALSLIAEIEKGIHKAANRVRYEMNGALISAGTRGGTVAKEAIAAAKRIGTVEVDHGDTSCTTPDAASYIKKVLDYHAAKANKASKAKKPKLMQLTKAPSKPRAKSSRAKV